jgi:xylan 1,4-beta-xylosidase
MTFDRRTFLRGTAGAAVAAAWPSFAQQAAVPVSVDTREVTGSLPHIWEECAGSDRAVDLPAEGVALIELV